MRLLIVAVCIAVCSIISGCAGRQVKEPKPESIRIVKVNRFSHMQSLREDGFNVISRKHPQDSAPVSDKLDYDDRGEEFIVIWRYDGPTLSEKPLTLYFDYNYPDDPTTYRITETYPIVYPGRHVFRLNNLGDDFHLRGEIQSWRATLFYGSTKVDEKQSTFFGDA